MGKTTPQLPPPFRLELLDQTDSTNAEAMRRFEQDEAGNLWIWARRQSAGRGRRGREWTSPEGNLYASLLLEPACGLETALQLVFVAGLALYDTAAEVSGIGAEQLRLKWPNDLLLDNKKAGGILLESAGGASKKGPAIIIGTGLNLASHPDDTAFPATHLTAYGAQCDPEQAFLELVRTTAHWLEIWADGTGWSEVRRAWSGCSLGPGTPIRVRLGDRTAEGRFGGIDESGALLLETNAGEERVAAGDVFLSRGGEASCGKKAKLEH